MRLIGVLATVLAFGQTPKPDETSPPAPQQPQRVLDAIDRPKTPGPAAETPLGEAGVKPSVKPEAPDPEEAWRKASTNASGVLARIDEAASAISAGDRERAARALDAAAVVLRDLHRFGPAELVRLLDGVAGDDFKALNAALQKYQLGLERAVVARVNEATRKYARGDHATALEDFQIAREKIVADAAIFAIDQVYTRVLAAQRAVDQKDDVLALAMLRATHAYAGELKVAVPLVPVRFDLRAAAHAVDTRSYDRARDLVNRAKGNVDALTTRENRLKPLQAQLTSVAGRFSGSSPRPTADELRRLSQRTHLQGGLET